jgi:hypothetical protein
MGTPTEQSFKNLAQAMAMNLLEDCFQRVFSDEAPYDDKVDFLKLTAKLGDLEPRPANTPIGTNFSIKVVYGGGGGQVPAGGVTIEQTAEPESLPETPSYFTPSFTTTHIAALSPLTVEAA